MGIEGVGKLGMGVVEGGVQGRWLFWGCTGSVGVWVFWFGGGAGVPNS